MIRALSLTLAAAAGLYALLLGTSSAVLVGSVLVQADPVLAAAGKQQSYLQCQYFTGLGTSQRELWFSPTGVWGVAACPRIIKL
jgi:hypothetical protein